MVLPVALALIRPGALLKMIANSAPACRHVVDLL
jgi:hypothetical protein